MAHQESSGVPLELTLKETRLFTSLIERLTGIQMGDSKRALLANRLSGCIKSLNLKSYSEYYQLLLSQEKSAGPEIAKFIDAITTNETYFFRSPKIWDYFSNIFLTDWFDKHSTYRSLVIWCAASASGEEAYTIGILCDEFSKKNPGFRWILRASDISQEMIKTAGEGIYVGRSLQNVSAERLKKYFTQLKDKTFQVSSLLKRKITFFQHKLQNLPHHHECDLVFLRNVMIYFGNSTKEQVMTNVSKALHPGGILIVGESEGLSHPVSGFQYIQPGVYRSIEESALG